MHDALGNKPGVPIPNPPLFGNLVQIIITLKQSSAMGDISLADGY